MLGQRVDALRRAVPGDVARRRADDELQRQQQAGDDAVTGPLRLPLGTDTLRAIADKHAFVERETAAWRGVAASTDFPQAA
ncbi:hypothetical protein ASD35_23525 [Pelomonas sp. Root1444]|nr:hypothetical protein ASD35_23525 [Pelomonas sp. Root1444]